MEAPLLRIAISLIVGIAVGDALKVPLPLLPVFVGTVVAALLARRWAQVQSLLICLCFVVLGALLVVQQKKGLQAGWPKGTAHFEAVVVSEPIEKPKTMAVDLLISPSGRKVKAYIHKDERSQRLHIGDRCRMFLRPAGSKRPSAERGVKCSATSNSYHLTPNTHHPTMYVRSWQWKPAVVQLGGLPMVERCRIFFLKQRTRLLKRFRSGGLKDDEYAVVAAMALGDKTALTKELKELYAETGASHVLALSGLHLSIVFTLLSLLTGGGYSHFGWSLNRRLRVVVQVVTVLSIWAFVFLVGLPVSVVRSASMLTLFALFSLGHRQHMSVNILCFTAIVMLCYSPLTLFDVGFQLSFMAVLSILLFLPHFTFSPSHSFTSSPSHSFTSSPFHSFTSSLFSFLLGLIAVSLAAQIGTAPLTAYYFGRFPTWFLLTNLVVVPAATLILYLSLATLLFPPLAMVLSMVVSALNSVLTTLSTLPLASIDGLHPTVWQVVLIYAVIFGAYIFIKRVGGNYSIS